MTIILELPTELEDELTREAARLGLSVPDYALRLLHARSSLEMLPQSGAELVAYWRNAGVVGVRKEIVDGQAHARQLRRTAERRDQGNHT